MPTLSKSGSKIKMGHYVAADIHYDTLSGAFNDDGSASATSKEETYTATFSSMINTDDVPIHTFR